MSGSGSLTNEGLLCSKVSFALSRARSQLLLFSSIQGHLSSRCGLQVIFFDFDGTLTEWEPLSACNGELGGSWLQQRWLEPVGLQAYSL